MLYRNIYDACAAAAQAGTAAVFSNYQQYYIFSICRIHYLIYVRRNILDINDDKLLSDSQ